MSVWPWIPVALATIFALTGVGMLIAPTTYRSEAAHLGVPLPRFRLIGALQVVGAAGVLIGLDRHWLGALAAGCLAVLTFGAVVVHRRAGSPFVKYVGALLCAIASVFVVVIFLNR